LKLPAEVDEYYKVKAKCEASGWLPGSKPPNEAAATAANSPHRIMAQALMKRAMSDIPIVQHIQKESNGMNRLYAQSMCSVKQWRSYQAAEAMVSAEVDEVRAEADEIEPGWGQVVWRQAMQYHQMLKQRHEQEAKAQEEAAKKQKAIAAAKNNNTKKKNGDSSAVAAAIAAPTAAATNSKPAPSKEELARAEELRAEKLAEELIKAEEREKESKKAFAAGGAGMKKGFLDKGKKK
jgi:Preprotein translocase subunit Sec66